MLVRRGMGSWSRVIGLIAACSCLVAPLSAGAAPQSHDGIHLHGPGHQALFTTTDTIEFSFESTWYHSAASTLHFFIGTSQSAPDNVVHRHETCPGSTTGPTCPTTFSYYNFQPGTYWWGVAHEFPGIETHYSDLWSFTVTADQHVRLVNPSNGSTFSTIEDIGLGWRTDWFNATSASTLHLFVGTGGASDNVVHEHFTCPAANAPSCPFMREIGKLPAGSYVWGVDHELPGVSLRKSPRWSFTVVERRAHLTPRPAPPLPRAPPRPKTSGPPGVAIVGNTLSYRGDARGNVVDLVKVGSWFLLTQDGSRLRVGRGCRRLDARSARCSSRRVRTFFADLGGGDDSIAATVALPSTILGGNGADHLEGGTRGDYLSGGPDRDTVDGGDGADRVYGESTDVLLGGTGDDAVIARTNLDGTADGGSGNDYLVGGPEDSVLLGGEGNDYLDGSGGNDKLFGGDGADILVGGEGGDTLRGGAKDEVSAGSGPGDGNDLMFCGPSSDIVDGLDPTQETDFSCDHAQTSFVGGVCGCYRAAVKWKLHRPAGARPHLAIYVDSPAKLETFNVKIAFLNAAGRAVAPERIVKVQGLIWVSLRKAIRLPNTVRKIVADVVPS